MGNSGSTGESINCAGDQSQAQGNGIASRSSSIASQKNDDQFGTILMIEAQPTLENKSILNKQGATSIVLEKTFSDGEQLRCTLAQMRLFKLLSNHESIITIQNIQNSLNNPNILRKGFSKFVGRVHCEYCPQTTYSLMRDKDFALYQKNQNLALIQEKSSLLLFKEDLLRNIFESVIEGLCQCVSNKIIHGDIRAQTIHLDANNAAKISIVQCFPLDFSHTNFGATARSIARGKSLDTIISQQNFYLAPEQLVLLHSFSQIQGRISSIQLKNFVVTSISVYDSYKSDVFSLGILMLSMIFCSTVQLLQSYQSIQGNQQSSPPGMYLYNQSTKKLEINKKLIDSLLEQVKQQYSIQFYTLIKKSLDQNPNSRLDCNQMKKEMKKIDFNTEIPTIQDESMIVNAPRLSDYNDSSSFFRSGSSFYKKQVTSQNPIHDKNSQYSGSQKANNTETFKGKDGDITSQFSTTFYPNFSNNNKGLQESQVASKQFSQTFQNFSPSPNQFIQCNSVQNQLNTSSGFSQIYSPIQYQLKQPQQTTLNQQNVQQEVVDASSFNSMPSKRSSQSEISICTSMSSIFIPSRGGSSYQTKSKIIKPPQAELKANENFGKPIIIPVENFSLKNKINLDYQPIQIKNASNFPFSEENNQGNKNHSLESEQRRKSIKSEVYSSLLCDQNVQKEIMSCRSNVTQQTNSSIDKTNLKFQNQQNNKIQSQYSSSSSSKLQLAQASLLPKNPNSQNSVIPPFNFSQVQTNKNALSNGISQAPHQTVFTSTPQDNYKHLTKILNNAYKNHESSLNSNEQQPLSHNQVIKNDNPIMQITIKQEPLLKQQTVLEDNIRQTSSMYSKSVSNYYTPFPQNNCFENHGMSNSIKHENEKKLNSFRNLQEQQKVLHSPVQRQSIKNEYNLNLKDNQQLSTAAATKPLNNHVFQNWQFQKEPENKVIEGNSNNNNNNKNTKQENGFESVKSSQIYADPKYEGTSTSTIMNKLSSFNSNQKPLLFKESFIDIQEQEEFNHNYGSHQQFIVSSTQVSPKIARFSNVSNQYEMPSVYSPTFATKKEECFKEEVLDPLNTNKNSFLQLEASKNMPETDIQYLTSIISPHQQTEKTQQQKEEIIPIIQNQIQESQQINIEQWKDLTDVSPISKQYIDKAITPSNQNFNLQSSQFLYPIQNEQKSISSFSSAFTQSANHVITPQAQASTRYQYFSSVSPKQDAYQATPFQPSSAQTTKPSYQRPYTSSDNQQKNQYSPQLSPSFTQLLSEQPKQKVDFISQYVPKPFDFSSEPSYYTNKPINSFQAFQETAYKNPYEANTNYQSPFQQSNQKNDNILPLSVDRNFLASMRSSQLKNINNDNQIYSLRQ